MQRSAACLASWFSVDGPLCPDCSAPLKVNQLTKLNTADSPLTEKDGEYLNHRHDNKSNQMRWTIKKKKKYRSVSTDKPIWRCLFSLKGNFSIRINKILHLRQRDAAVRSWNVDGSRVHSPAPSVSVVLAHGGYLSYHWQNGKELLVCWPQPWLWAGAQLGTAAAWSPLCSSSLPWVCCHADGRGQIQSWRLSGPCCCCQTLSGGSQRPAWTTTSPTQSLATFQLGYSYLWAAFIQAVSCSVAYTVTYS